MLLLPFGNWSYWSRQMNIWIAENQEWDLNSSLSQKFQVDAYSNFQIEKMVSMSSYPPLCCERKWAMKLTFSTVIAAHIACTLLVTVLKLFPWPHLLKDTVHICSAASTFVWKKSLLACCDVISLQRNGPTKCNAGNSKISEVRLTYNTTNNCGFEKMLVDFEEMLNLSSVSNSFGLQSFKRTRSHSVPAITVVLF